jgi:nucleotide-binding universal stress UspA family protein
MTTASDNNSAIRIRKILVPIDGSEFSLNAARYAIKIAKDENAQIICIHVISTIVLEYAPPEYRDDMKKKVESWFNTIS